MSLFLLLGSVIAGWVGFHLSVTPPATKRENGIVWNVFSSGFVLGPYHWRHAMGTAMYHPCQKPSTLQRCNGVDCSSNGCCWQAQSSVCYYLPAVYTAAAYAPGNMYPRPPEDSWRCDHAVRQQDRRKSVPDDTRLLLNPCSLL